MWLITSDLVLAFLLLYCHPGISKFFGQKFGWNSISKLETPLISLSFYLESASSVCSFRWIEEPIIILGVGGAAKQTLHLAHSVCFTSSRMWRICGSRLLNAVWMVIEETILLSLLLIKKNVWGNANVWDGMRWTVAFNFCLKNITLIIFYGSVVPKPDWLSGSYWELRFNKRLLKPVFRCYFRRKK